MSETLVPPGLPEPPPAGTSALPAGTFAGVAVLVTGGGTGLGLAVATEFARLGASLVVASRKDEHLAAGRAWPPTWCSPAGRWTRPRRSATGSCPGSCRPRHWTTR